MNHQSICLSISCVFTILGTRKGFPQESVCSVGFSEACIGYFGIRDIGLLFKGYWDICGVFLFWDMGYSGILGHGILEFILGYELD